jgi:hypothetical protein
MDVEKARVTSRAERLNAQAASFLTGRTHDLAERVFHGALVSGARMKTSEDEQLQAFSLSESYQDEMRPAADRAGLDREGVRMAQPLRHFSSPEIPIA